MIYTDKGKLTCYVISNESDEVRFNELGSILMEQPSNIIYCEKKGKLYGIISMGDIVRAYVAGKDFVVVNTRFTSVKPNEYMRVKQIFKDNDKINALPVVNDLNELIGDFSSWDDLIAVNDWEWLRRNKYAMDFWKKKRKIALVRPCEKFAKKQELMKIYEENLLRVGVQVFEINREDVMNTFDRVDYILFTDEDEKRGTEVLYKNIFDRKFDRDKVRTYAGISDEISNEISDEILNSIALNGIPIFTLYCENNGSNYWKMLEKDNFDKFFKIGEKMGNIVHEEWRKDFFAELYSEEYARKILSHNYAVEFVDGICKLKNTDERGGTNTVIKGERRTLAQPSDFQRCIYFFGPCIVIGYNVADEHTIESFLQAKINAKGYKVKCINYGVWADRWTELNRVASTGFHKGDIIIFFNQYKNTKKFPGINLADICEKYNVPTTWMTDNPLHCNHKLNSIYADEIFKMIEPVIQENIEEKEPVKEKGDFIKLSYLDRYFYGFAETHSGRNGSIVMNCNPFTLGHRYLIEQALKQVDHLIIFVVEEDKSLFSFKERLAMVVEGTRDLKNVTVAPSGCFILSRTTFPEYFLKVEDEDIVHNVEYDITLFAEQIAPKLNITYRFVGEEPEDTVTNKYNEAMKRILPKHGISIVEIPRVKTGGKIISASLVRKKLFQGECTDMDGLIPETTRAVLDICWK